MRIRLLWEAAVGHLFDGDGSNAGESSSYDTNTTTKKEKKETRERGARPWMEKREKPCPGWRKHERRALVGTDGKRALKKRAEFEIGVERR
ncbi:hypothetical protein TNCV_1017281 [Trichonephila clavipes]|uniref:Uncharacterized protein n=1 Tax=Trichonephila clavipes TaxID=2585209 RepID=A0A8X6VY14_TRICX|nr:hypothetical protein TNCV_1017281 [Trichonephila clavipes]